MTNVIGFIQRYFGSAKLKNTEKTQNQEISADFSAKSKKIKQLEANIQKLQESIKLAQYFPVLGKNDSEKQRKSLIDQLQKQITVMQETKEDLLSPSKILQINSLLAKITSLWNSFINLISAIVSRQNISC